MLKAFCFTNFLALYTIVLAQDSVKILFVYGSRPKDDSESKWFGGIHGGHVSVEYRDGFVSFLPSGKFHVFPRREFHSAFDIEKENTFVFDTNNSRYRIITIPVTIEQKQKLDSVASARLITPPYDYAFFGMRCASSAYELLATAGIFEQRSTSGMVRRYFYPKLLRKRLIKLAIANRWYMVYRPGRKTRKWEKD